jgi:hypothetical protein
LGTTLAIRDKFAHCLLSYTRKPEDAGINPMPWRFIPSQQVILEIVTLARRPNIVGYLFNDPILWQLAMLCRNVGTEK